MRVSDALSGVFSAYEGALTQLWAATWKKEDVKSGAYYMPVGKVDSASKFSQDPELAKKLGMLSLSNGTWMVRQSYKVWSIRTCGSAGNKGVGRKIP
jgi:hypothetical protein